MNEAYKKLVLTLDVSTATEQVYNLGDYTHFNYVSLIIDYTGMDKADATVKFVQSDASTGVWNDVPTLSATLDGALGVGSVELANAQFTAANVGIEFANGTATDGTITVKLIAKSW